MLGKKEQKRWIAKTPAPSDEVRDLLSRSFDRAYYLSINVDVQRSGSDPLDHFIAYGWRERRNPSPLFDTAYYLASNTDVAESNVNPFYHYLNKGCEEGRRPNPVGFQTYPSMKPPPDKDWQDCRTASDLATADYVIIMPVYQGFDETLAAIFAVLVLPQTTSFALHVINDKTPDARLHSALADLAERRLFSYAVNDTNLGFVETCNRGLRLFADKEVVLLNADAKVTGNWLDRMAAHAARDPRIATITPLSNNATICSYPTANDNNLIETECPAELLDMLAAECNAGRASDLPTGVGFCFYMSRASRAEVGIFDVAAFGRGYGEENDFCLRAAKAGFRNVLAEDIFVYHAGQVSFAQTAANGLALGQAALLAKHPDYPGRIKRHLHHDPGADGRLRLDLKRLARFAHNRSMLFISHALSGGVVTHIRDMERRLAEEGITVVNLRVGVGDALSIQISCEAGGAPFCPNLRSTSLPQFRSLFKQFLDWLAPLAIHVHSLVGFDWRATTDMLELVEASGFPHYFTLHDYSVVCHRNNLMLTSGDYCGLPEVDVCRTCVQTNRTYPEATDPAVRRRTFETFLMGAHAVFAPSQDIAARLQAAGAKYPILLRPHEMVRGPYHERADRNPKTSVATSDNPIVVVVVGAIGVHKGSQVLVDLARDAKTRGLPIQYHIVGYSDMTNEMIASGVSESGSYSDEGEAASIVEALQPHCIFLPSIWPETFCYTLDLAFQLGIPPVVFDLGAQRDRVVSAGFGFVLPYYLKDCLGDLNQALIDLPFREMRSSIALGTNKYDDILSNYYGLNHGT